MAPDDLHRVPLSHRMMAYPRVKQFGKAKATGEKVYDDMAVHGCDIGHIITYADAYPEKLVPGRNRATAARILEELCRFRSPLCRFGFFGCRSASATSNI